MLRLRTRRLDLAAFVVHAPAAQGTAQARAEHQRLWDWVAETMRELPHRTTPAVLADANAHIGGREVRDEHGILLVGQEGAEAPSQSGMILAQFLHKSGLGGAEHATE